MFKFLATLLLAAQAAAFYTPNKAKAPADLVGVSLPIGFFDPLGFSNCDAKTLNKYRDSELKHGRVAMLAVFGVLTQDRFHPFYGGANSGNPLAAIEQIPSAGWLQILAAIGVTEFCLGKAAEQPGYKAGDYFGIADRVVDSKDSNWISMQTRELNNGRLAMFAIIGELAHAQISGLGPFEQLHSVGMIP